MARAESTRAATSEILQLRALQLSDRWDAAMPRILGPLRTPVHIVICRSEGLRVLLEAADFRAELLVSSAGRTPAKTCDLAILQMLTHI